MAVRRAVCAMAVAVLLGGCVAGSGAAYSGDDGENDGKPSWKHKGDGTSGTATADRIALDELGDARHGVDIQSLAVFNRANLDFVGLTISGRDFHRNQARAVQVFLETKAKRSGPDYRLVAFNEKPRANAPRVRLYRVGGWAANTAKRVSCDRVRVQFDIEQVSQIRIAVPRECLGGVRGSLRANATVWHQKAPEWKTQPGQGSGVDVIPEERELTPDTR